MRRLFASIIAACYYLDFKPDHYASALLVGFAVFCAIGAARERPDTDKTNYHY